MLLTRLARRNRIATAMERAIVMKIMQQPLGFVRRSSGGAGLATPRQRSTRDKSSRHVVESE